MADQNHPREKQDRLVINNLLQGEINDRNLAELARLLIRYQNFPGAKAIQKDLQFILQTWELTEDELFAKTRKIHAQGKVYMEKVTDIEKAEDWS